MITVNLYYKGKGGAAAAFAEEMESSGTADAVRAEDSQYYSMSWERTADWLGGVTEADRQIDETDFKYEKNSLLYGIVWLIGGRLLPTIPY